MYREGELPSDPIHCPELLLRHTDSGIPIHHPQEECRKTKHRDLKHGTLPLRVHCIRKQLRHGCTFTPYKVVIASFRRARYMDVYNVLKILIIILPESAFVAYHNPNCEDLRLIVLTKFDLFILPLPPRSND